MDIRITHRTEIIDGKGYSLTITRISGLQEVYINGKPTLVSQVTIHDCRDGCSVGYRRANQESMQSDISENKLPPSVEARIKDVAVQAMISQGIW